jgi:signal transduction histidine kinase
MAPNDAAASGLIHVAELADIVAHEVNNLLNSVVLHAALLERSIPQEARAGVQAELGVIRQAIQRAGTMLRRWQQATPQPPASLEPLDLKQTIREVAFPEAVRNAAGEQISFRAHLAPDLPLVFGSAEDSKRLLRLLVKSAVEASREGGTVTVRAEPASGQVVLSVEDRGAAVAHDALDRVFEPFAGVRGGLFSASDEVELWLPTCKVLARRQKCTITAAPGNAGGLTISVRYPVADK